MSILDIALLASVAGNVMLYVVVDRQDKRLEQKSFENYSLEQNLHTAKVINSKLQNGMCDKCKPF